jgi:hypothetical protein
MYDKDPLDITQGVKGFVIGVWYAVVMVAVIMLAGCGGTIDGNGAYTAMSPIDIIADSMTLGSGPIAATGTR